MPEQNRIDERLLLKYLTLFFVFFFGIIPILKFFLTNLSLGDISVFDTRISTIFIRTILLAITTSILATGIGTLLAFFMEYLKCPLLSTLQKTYLLPLITPPYINAIAWLSAFRVTETHIGFDIPFDPYNLLFTIFIMTLSFYPIATLIVSLGIKNIEINLENAANLIYPKTKAITKIILPLLAPHILLSALIIFILTMSEFAVPSLLTVNVFTTEIFTQFSAFFDSGKAAMLSVPLLVSLIVLLELTNRYLKKRNYIPLKTVSRNTREKKQLNGLRSTAINLFAFLILATILIPLIALLVSSNLEFAKALQSGAVQIVNSVRLGIITAFLLSGLSFLSAYFIKEKLSRTIIFPAILPAMITGLSIIYFFNNDFTGFIYKSMIIIAITHTALFHPFTNRVFLVFLKQINQSIEEAARLSGASFARQLKDIILPLSRPGFIATFYLGFIFSLRELSATLLVSPAGFQSLQVKIFTLMHAGSTDLVCCLCIINIVLIMAPAYLFNRIKRE